MMTDAQKEALQAAKDVVRDCHHLNPSTNELIAYLNHVLMIDSEALTRLMEHRIECNEAMTEHPLIQTQPDDDPLAAPGSHVVDLLGLLNGFCGIYHDGPKKGYGPITAEYDDVTHQIVAFRKTRNMKEPDWGSKEPGIVMPDEESSAVAPLSMLEKQIYKLKAGDLVRFLGFREGHRTPHGSFHVPFESEACSFVLDLAHVERLATAEEIQILTDKKLGLR